MLFQIGSPLISWPSIPFRVQTIHDDIIPCRIALPRAISKSVSIRVVPFWSENIPCRSVLQLFVLARVLPCCALNQRKIKDLWYILVSFVLAVFLVRVEPCRRLLESVSNRVVHRIQKSVANRVAYDTWISNICRSTSCRAIFDRVSFETLSVCFAFVSDLVGFALDF